jgi:4-amino-4-deoxy-L-arabinose transferase-like glycosyltransferase
VFQFKPLAASRWARPAFRAKPQAIILTLWCAVLFLYGLSAGPLYRTESLRAIIGSESLRGNWLYPVLYGEPFLTKPPGQYAAIALCSLPFGEVTDWSARIPSAIAATFTVLLLWRLLREVLNERESLLAAMLIPCSVLWLDKAPSAEIDMSLTGWVAAAMFLFHKSLGEARPWRRAGLYLLSYFCLTAGTLTKWTAPAFFFLTILPLLAWRRELHRLLDWRHLLATGFAAGLFALWAAAVANEVGWDALVSTIRGEAAYRFNPPPKAKGYPFGEVVTYPLLVLAAHLPLAFFALRTLRSSFLNQFDDRGRLLLQVLHCWVWPSLLFWSVVPNHNVRYILPISPALMALGAIGWFRGRFAPRSADSAPRLTVVFLAFWLIAKIVFVEVIVPNRHRDARPAAAQLRELVPNDETLHLFKLKDEGVLFYFGRPAKRLHDPADLPPGGIALLLKSEWDHRADYGDVQLLREMYDQQGDPIFLVRSK